MATQFPETFQKLVRGLVLYNTGIIAKKDKVHVVFCWMLEFDSNNGFGYFASNKSAGHGCQYLFQLSRNGLLDDAG